MKITTRIGADPVTEEKVILTSTPYGDTTVWKLPYFEHGAYAACLAAAEDLAGYRVTFTRKGTKYYVFETIS